MDQIHLRNYLLEQHPKDVDAWLQSATNRSTFSHEDFQWWLGLAQGATFRAESGFQIDTPSQDFAVMWARVGVTIYEYLLAQPSNASACLSLELSLMELRTFFITRLGMMKNDPLLDVEQIIQWFFQNLPYSLQGLTELVNVWHTIKKRPSAFKQLSQGAKIVVGQRIFQAETLQKMRWVKKKLKILKTLSESNCLSLTQNNELKSWILLWEQLP